MICPKCKNEVEDKSLKCPKCGAKIGILCSDCGEYNAITSTECSKCGKVLLRLCKECNAANLPDAELCRKCGSSLLPSELDTEKIQKHPNSANSQQKVRERLLEGIKNPNLNIITLSGSSGSGKNLILRAVVNQLKNAKLIWLMGTCSQATQLSPFGYFQDLLLTFFNINNYCPDTLQLKKNSIKFFKQDFPTLSHQEILDLLNLLYPEQTDKYENIYYNKSKSFVILKKVLLTIIEKMKTIFVIDKFEYIDGMSFDFIKEFLKDETITERCKFVVLTNEPRLGMGILPANNLTEVNYLDLEISPFTQAQTEEFLKQYPDKKYGQNFIETVMALSDGYPANIEQIVLLRNDLKRLGLKSQNYKTMHRVIEHRLSILKQEDFRAYRLLAAFSVLGIKFYPAALTEFDNNSQAEFERIIKKLLNFGFITQINNLSFEFKSESIWKAAVNVLKNDENFDEILNRLFETLSMYRQSSPALLAYITQKLNDNKQAFDIWTTLMKNSSYIGDIGLYIICQKQALKLIENKNTEFYQMVKKHIYTRVGKLLEPIDAKAAFEYLQNAVMMLEENETSEYIELMGYIASSAMKTGNYFGSIECAERVLSQLPENMKLEAVLVKSRTVTPLLRLGNYGQLINMVETELFSEIEPVLNKGKNTSLIKIDELFELWLGIYFDYAEALAFQGDNKVFDVISTIDEILDKNNETRPSILCRMNLLLALANTIKGDINISNKLLDDMLSEYSIDSMNSDIVSRWNFIDVINKFIEKDYMTLQTELFNVAAYANNVNDNFTKNILKTILAKILKSNNQTKKAAEILDEQVSYFAKEKSATGVLLSWYLISEIKLITAGAQTALDIATKALDIAKSPNINNYYFIALFNKLIGEIYMAKQDFDSAKVYFEKAIFMSKQFNLDYILVKTYLQCAKLYQELALPKSNSRGVYIKQAIKMFQLAKNVSIVPTQSFLQKEIKDELSVLTSFCKLNGIVLKKES